MRRLVKSSRVVAVLAAVAAGLTCTTGDSALAAISTTTPADSFEYEIRSCDGSVTGEGRSSIGWERWMGASGETHVEACPDEGIGFDLTSDLKLGDSFGWVFWPYGQLKVSSTTMLVTKGDSDTGIIYSVSTCAGCASQGTIDVPGTGQPGAPQRFDFTPATGFVVTGICMRPVCARTDGLRFKDVKMTMYDNDPPLLELLSPMIWLSQNGDVLARSRFGDWNRPDQFGVDAIAADRGVGFGGGELLVDGIRVAAMSGACWLIPQRIPGRTSPCPTYSTRFADSLENAGIPDGWHLLAFKLEDALGNSNVVG
ncbi:MAG: hypothetical protein HY827_01710, partial [Actinobacteria bacterium]|nr:hypothetical protein [Actinomycetota bacterium]